MNVGPLKVAIISVAAVVAIGILTIPFDKENSNGGAFVWVALFAATAVSLVAGFRYLTARKQAQLQLTSSEQYRALAEEYRRLSDLAITAQEHADLKMGEISAQLDHVRTQIDSLQKILRDVE
ncbi:MAG TPA: hypothetical protein VMU95_13100 [Trebonia sp.]|nr:hypothetical protein [Trebonia sp.]